MSEFVWIRVYVQGVSCLFASFLLIHSLLALPSACSKCISEFHQYLRTMKLLPSVMYLKNTVNSVVMFAVTLQGLKSLVD